jgi:hypothetical protein
MSARIENVKLKMIEGYTLPNQTYNKETKAFVKTGGEKQFYRYTFISNDEFKNKLELSSSEDYSKFEDKVVNIIMGVSVFANKPKLSLDGVSTR